MAGVIRGQTVFTPQQYSFADMEREADALRKQAEREAEQILADARQRGERLAEEAHQEAFALGEREGRAAGHQAAYDEARELALHEARDRLAHLGGALQQALSEYEQAKRALLARAERGLLTLALSVAERVCKMTVGRTTDAAVANTRRLLEMVRSEQNLHLLISPADYDAVREVLADLQSHAEQLEHVELIPDDQTPRGGCVLRGAHGTRIDATIETQIQRIAEAMLGDPDRRQDPRDGGGAE